MGDNHECISDVSIYRGRLTELGSVLVSMKVSLLFGRYLCLSFPMIFKGICYILPTTVKVKLHNFSNLQFLKRLHGALRGTVKASY